MTNKNNEIIIYQSEDGQTQVDVRMENETVWLTQAQMAELFQTDRTSIVRHINNIYKVEELERESTCAKIAQVQMEGSRAVTRQVPIFNLDMIISVGYRVNAKRGVQFRKWANKILKDPEEVCAKFAHTTQHGAIEEKDEIAKVCMHIIPNM